MKSVINGVSLGLKRSRSACILWFAVVVRVENKQTKNTHFRSAAVSVGVVPVPLLSRQTHTDTLSVCDTVTKRLTLTNNFMGFNGCLIVAL